MEAKGFLYSLFDLSFREFITIRIIKILYIISIICSAIAALLLSRALPVVVAIIVVPIVFFLYVLLARIWLELVIAILRIAENTGRLVEQGKLKPTTNEE